MASKLRIPVFWIKTESTMTSSNSELIIGFSAAGVSIRVSSVFGPSGVVSSVLTNL
jgi:hypothetical protein